MIAPLIVVTKYDQDIPYEDFKFYRFGYREVGFELKTKKLKLNFVLTPGKIILSGSD